VAVTVIFRAMRNRSWTKAGNGRATPAAFFRREAAPEKGRPAEESLSVDVESHQSCHNALNECFGVAELDVSECDSKGFTLTLDAHPHAGLSGMPLQSEDKGKAEFCASQLAKISRLVLPADYPPVAAQSS
jgi:hypothetical protein